VILPDTNSVMARSLSCLDAPQVSLSLGDLLLQPAALLRIERVNAGDDQVGVLDYPLHLAPYQFLQPFRPDVGLKTPPPLTVGLDPESGVVHVVVLAGLREVPEPAQPATHVLQLRLDGLQSPSLFAYQAVRLSGNDFRRIGDG
jgi:hypothetical protein